MGFLWNSCLTFCKFLGGASSLSVFDNNIGSGSISPLIVTGGKGGDVGLHDFRYIATGRTKKHKHSDASEQNSSTPAMDMWNKSGDQNRNGMLWYIPKAHSGNSNCITTRDIYCNIPNLWVFTVKGVWQKYLPSQIPVFSWLEVKMEMWNCGTPRQPD